MPVEGSDAPPSQSRFSVRGTDSSTAQPGSSVTPVSRRPSRNGPPECLIPSPHKSTPSRSSSLIPRRTSAAVSQRDQNAGEHCCTVSSMHFAGPVRDACKASAHRACYEVVVLLLQRESKWLSESGHQETNEAGGAVRVGPDHRGMCSGQRVSPCHSIPPSACVLHSLLALCFEFSGQHLP